MNLPKPPPFFNTTYSAFLPDIFEHDTQPSLRAVDDDSPTNYTSGTMDHDGYVDFDDEDEDEAPKKFQYYAGSDDVF
jgi:hypothetical protein